MDERNVVLVRLVTGGGEGLARLRETAGARARIAVWQALDSGSSYVYIVPAGDVDAAAVAIRKALPDADVARLQTLMQIDGASAGETPAFHYVVETDVAPEAEPDFNAWYDQEHLAGLASVDGTVRAWRYRNLDAGPRYHACYDLARREAFGSPAWLAVRATPWSDRVRPSFRNTRRTMFRRSNID